MATGTEAPTWRDLEGLCDWCGDKCHPNSELCVVLSCNRCDDVNIYHQGCLEKFLKQYGFPSSRKVGFICPQGRGKGTKATKECPGRVERSHPVIPKNEVKKKKASPPPLTEVMGKTVNKQPAAKQQTNKSQQAAKPGPAGAQKFAHSRPYEVTARFGSSSGTPALVPSAWNRAEGVNLAVFEPPSEPVEPAYTATAAGQPKSAHVPVGLVLEEALTKAQKKNLARRKKKQQAVATDGQHSETGSEVPDGSTDPNSLDEWAAAEQQNQAGEQAGENLLAGHNKFVTNPARYLQLLGLLDPDAESDAEPDVEEDNNAIADTPVLPHPGSAHSSSLGSAMSVAESPIPPSSVPVEVPVAVPIVVPVTLPTSVPIASEATATVIGPTAVAAKETADGDAALREALAQSVKQYELEQEMYKQRMILAGEMPMPSGALGPVVATNATPATPLTFDFTQASAVSPLVIESPLRDTAPSLLPSMEPQSLGITMAASDASLVPDTANGEGYGYSKATAGLFGFNNISLPQPKANMVVNPAMASAYAPMAQGNHAPAMAHNADEDDLTDLLALCGVAN